MPRTPAFEAEYSTSSGLVPKSEAIEPVRTSALSAGGAGSAAGERNESGLGSGRRAFLTSGR
jgi:hypothetical protein